MLHPLARIIILTGTHDAHPFGLNREKKILTSDHAPAFFGHNKRKKNFVPDFIPETVLFLFFCGLRGAAGLPAMERS
jgi:hypothetical protein